MVAVIRQQSNPLTLEECALRDLTSGSQGTLGGLLRATGPVELTLRLEPSDPARSRDFLLTVIRYGQVIYQTTGRAPWQGRIIDDERVPGQQTYYRVEVGDSSGKTLVTNPIFVRFTRSGES